MHVLKNSIFIVTLLIFGCASSSYKIILDNQSSVKVVATADRYLPYCEKVIKDDGTIAYGFMVFFLDEEKTVGTAAGMLTSEKYCLKWKSGVQKILDAGGIITLKGSGNMKEPRTFDEYAYKFEKHGTYPSNGRSMAFFSILNSHGTCFSVDPDRCLE